MTNVDELAQIIRQVDGNHSLGAGALAEAIIAKLPHIAARQPVGDCSESALYESVGNLLEAPGSWTSGYTDALHDLREAYSRYGQKPVMQGPLAEVSSKSFNSDGTSNIITPSLPLGTKLYAAPAQAVDLGQLPDGWRLSKKSTCYQLSHGNDIVGNLIGPDAEENAGIIARVLDSKAVGND